jgi:tetratricopeptide (TPR) repeat protein
MDSEHPRDCEVAFRDGMMALDAEDPHSALEFLRKALKDGLDGPYAIEACVICCTILYDYHLDEEALAMGERTLDYDRNDMLLGELERNTEIREQLFVRLDNLWGQVADRIEEGSVGGKFAARGYLRSRLDLTNYLPDKYLPGVYCRLGGYAEEIGSKEEARQWYRKVLDTKFTGLKDLAVTRQLNTLRAGASLRFDKLSGGAEGNRGGCWVATAIYGEASEEVRVLRLFRDSVLSHSAFGRMLVNSYYRTGPHIANAARRFPILRWLLRVVVVSPIVALAARFAPVSKRG